MELVLQVKKLRHNEGKQLALSHKASKACWSPREQTLASALQ